MARTAIRAFIEDGSTGIRDTTLAEHNAMLGRIAYLYQQAPSVELSVVASNGNISPNMTDTRYRSGTAARNTSGAWPAVTSYPPESTTGEPQLVVGTTYDKIEQTINAPATFLNSDYQSLNTKPIFMEADGSLREMSYTECLAYFAGPVIDAMMSTSVNGVQAGGSYYISTSSSISGSTQIGLVFADTVANLAGYLPSNIGLAGSVQDVHTTTNYYLQRVDSNISSQGSGYRTPLMIDTSTNRKNTPTGLRHMTYAEFDALFEPMIKYAIHAAAGYTLRYNVNGNGTRQGTQIANRQMIGVSGAYTKYAATADDYRAQEFPNGTIVVQDAFNLNLERT